ncbi:MAG: hypothetical protein ACREX8_02120 [Gammaproteobacteria bacterium]
MRGAAERSADLRKVAHREQDGEAGPAGEVVAVVVDEVAGPAGILAVAVGGVPGRGDRAVGG